MSELLKTALSLSLSGAVMILAVLITCKLLKGRISNSWRYYIWLLVVLRLLIPYSPEISLIGTLFQGGAARAIADTAPVSQAEGMANPGTVYSGATNSAPEPAPNPAPNPAPTDKVVRERPAAVSVNITLQAILPWLWIPWLLVALILLIRKITMYQSFAKYVRAGQTDVTDEALLVEFSRICGQAGVKRPIELRTNSLIASPLLLGIFRPCVILPTTAMLAEDRRFIYLHELTHYKRGDIFYKWLLQLALCLHWFNPLVYVMVREANRACELSCDAAVIRPMNTDERRRYGNALLESLESPGSYRESLAAVTLHENSVLLKERLESIKKYGKNNKWQSVVSVILCLGVFIGGFALGAYLPDRAAISEPNGGERTPEGLPIMSASNREIYETYFQGVAVSGLFRINFSPEDISALLEREGASLLTILHALVPEAIESIEFSEDYEKALPAAFVEDTLCSKLPLYPDKVREVLAGAYDAETKTYRYSGGLGGGPALPIVTGFSRNGKLLTIQYTWYVGDPAADGFRYASDDSGELIVELSGDSFRYRSNRVIEKPAPVTDAGTVSSAEGYNIREKYGFIVLNDPHEKLLMALAWTNILLNPWQTPEKIDPDGLVILYYLLGNQPFSEYDWKTSADKYDMEDGWILIPAEELEEAIGQHFDVSTGHMRESGYYIADRNVYWFGGTGSVANAKIIGVRQDGDIHLIDYELYSDITLVGSGTLEVRIGDKRSDYQYLSNEFVRVPLTDKEQEIKDSLIVVGPDMTLEEKIVMGLTKTGCAFGSWQNAEENHASELISIYSFLADIGEISIPENVERDPFYKNPYLPAEDVERLVQSYYNVGTEYLRTYYQYDAGRGLYQIPSIPYAAECRIVESNRDGNILAITFEIYQALHLDYMVTVTAEIQADGGYRYLSCESEWVG